MTAVRDAVVKDNIFRDVLIYDLRSSSAKSVLAEGRKPFLDCSGKKVLSRGMYGVPTGALLFDSKDSLLNKDVGRVDVYAFIPRYDRVLIIERMGKDSDWRLRAGSKYNHLLMEVRGGKILAVHRQWNGRVGSRLEQGRIEGRICGFVLISLWYYFMGGLFVAGQRRAGNPYMFGDKVQLYSLSEDD